MIKKKNICFLFFLFVSNLCFGSDGLSQKAKRDLSKIKRYVDDDIRNLTLFEKCKYTFTDDSGIFFKYKNNYLIFLKKEDNTKFFKLTNEISSGANKHVINVSELELKLLPHNSTYDFTFQEKIHVNYDEDYVFILCSNDENNPDMINRLRKEVRAYQVLNKFLEKFNVCLTCELVYVFSPKDDCYNIVGLLMTRLNKLDRKIEGRLLDYSYFLYGQATGLHDENIINSDIKDSNLMIHKSGIPIIIDHESGVDFKSNHSFHEAFFTYGYVSPYRLSLLFYKKNSEINFEDGVMEDLSSLAFWVLRNLLKEEEKKIFFPRYPQFNSPKWEIKKLNTMITLLEHDELKSDLEHRQILLWSILMPYFKFLNNKELSPSHGDLKEQIKKSIIKYNIEWCSEWDEVKKTINKEDDFSDKIKIWQDNLYDKKNKWLQNYKLEKQNDNDSISYNESEIYDKFLFKFYNVPKDIIIHKNNGNSVMTTDQGEFETGNSIVIVDQVSQDESNDNSIDVVY